MPTPTTGLSLYDAARAMGVIFTTEARPTDTPVPAPTVAALPTTIPVPTAVPTSVPAPTAAPTP